MKTVFLILYFWHADGQKTSWSTYMNHTGTSIAMNGGPVLKIEHMDSLRQCEVIGSTVKNIMDSMAHGPDPQSTDFRAALFRCVEVAK